MFFFPYYDIEILKKMGVVFGNLGFLVQIQFFFFSFFLFFNKFLYQMMGKILH
jgi:hypothetical protein